MNALLVLHNKAIFDNKGFVQVVQELLCQIHEVDNANIE
jgi:hypothetical protein